MQVASTFDTALDRTIARGYGDDGPHAGRHLPGWHADPPRMDGLPAGDFQSDGTRYSSKKLYARAKREELVITELWAEKPARRGIVVHAMHPGWVDIRGMREWLPMFRARRLRR